MQTHLLILLGGILGSLFGLIFSLLYLAFIAAAIYGMWKIFEKAGKPGWACLIPIYNIIVLHEIVGRELVKILFLFIPLANIYFVVTLYISLAKSFGKRETGEYVLTIFFAPFYLGLGNAQYVGPSEGPGAVLGGVGATTPIY
ncbi:DUF5684 domain-containing protein [Hymenobacter terrenus]|uniref:DUF5684 domain-containing protein n=1 Tax=Hymenobacter terrenus TaxID=1629124 RepID=UPI00061930F3|nr:DUF5684 domain-containing protein [Hymenobacter terrenus]